MHGRDAVTVVNAKSGRLLFALNDAAEQDGPRLGRQIGRELAVLFDGELHEATAGQIERLGREKLAALAVSAAETWRQQRKEAIEQGLAAVDARLATALKGELEVLRDSAAELLGLDLAVPEPEGRLAESRRFFYEHKRTGGSRPPAFRLGNGEIQAQQLGSRIAEHGELALQGRREPGIYLRQSLLDGLLALLAPGFGGRHRERDEPLAAQPLNLSRSGLAKLAVEQCGQLSADLSAQPRAILLGGVIEREQQPADSH